jgi:hypothetical protein
MKVGDLVQIDFRNIRPNTIGLIIDHEKRPGMGYRKAMDIWTVQICQTQTTESIDNSDPQIWRFLSRALTVIS